MKTTRYTLLMGLLLVMIAPANAQDAEAPPEGWNTGLIGKAALAQVGFQNWNEGGVNSLSISTGLDGSAKKTDGRLQQAHEMRLAYGLIKQGEQDLRKAEDLISLKGTWLYQGEDFFARFKPTFGATLRTQFYEGLNFDKNPFGDDRPPPVKVSDLFAPATLTQSLGLTYAPEPWINQSLGVAAKETVVTIERLRPLYAVDPDKSIRFEVGLEAVTNVDKQLMENINYKSTLRLFAAYNQTGAPDLLWENLIAMKVNEWISVNFELTTLYDADITKQLQLKEVLTVGLSYILY
ncbi:MAG: DUF3078 domain-containing protein [Rhodothermales bacterium]